MANALQNYMLVRLGRRHGAVHTNPQGLDLHFLRQLQFKRGDAQKGKAYLAGIFSLPGGQVEIPTLKDLFTTAPPNAKWHACLHGFDWLHHLRALPQTAKTPQTIHALLSMWLQLHQHITPTIIWKPAVTAERLIAWCAILPFISFHSPQPFLQKLTTSILYQASHLARTKGLTTIGEEKITVAVAQIILGLAIQGKDSAYYTQGQDMLRASIHQQFFLDGGHKSRNPNSLLHALIKLTWVQQALTLKDTTAAFSFTEEINHMRKRLRFFCHDNGTLALFNGATAQDADTTVFLTKLLRLKPDNYAPQSAYHRLQGGKSLVIVDTGNPPDISYSRMAHDSALSFEFSHGKNPIVVNCGSGLYHGAAWHEASRLAAAHSVLSFPNMAGDLFLSSRLLVSMVGPCLIQNGQQSTNRRAQNKEGTWLEAQHDGYVRKCRVVYSRLFHLSKEGTCLRGEDRLTPARPEQQKKMSLFRRPKAVLALVRFHLHPDLRVSRTQNGQQIIVLLKDRSGWRFQASDTQGRPLKLRLEDSIYMGTQGQRKTCQQIIIPRMVFPYRLSTVRWQWQQISS